VRHLVAGAWFVARPATTVEAMQHGSASDAGRYPNPVLAAAIDRLKVAAAEALQAVREARSGTST
jgi:hypothetical protein